MPFAKVSTFEALKALGGEVPPVPDEPPLAMPYASLATSFEVIEAGHLVLAPEATANSGWFEAVVVEIKPEDLVVLRWHAWPDLPPIVRRQDDLALLRRAPASDDERAEE